MLLLMEVLGWSASEVADSLDTSVASVNSALQRARATLQNSNAANFDMTEPAVMSEAQAQMVDRYVDAFERYDVDQLTALLCEDAVMSMPPYAFWLRGTESIRDWLLGRGSGCRGSRLIRVAACGSPAFGQYRPNPEGGYMPWGLVVLELSGDRVARLNTFLDTAMLFPRFGLPPKLF